MNRWAKEVPKQRARVRVNLKGLPKKRFLFAKEDHQFTMETNKVVNKLYDDFRGALVMVTITRMKSFGGPRKKAAKHRRKKDEDNDM